ncbi:MAG TPA: TetR/AcrR family transcriptional regulator [Sporichthyaceae bacterium]|jgi:AcrR family transcriptional regulator|nr:TetR/AcrR family transcriptional regulator [Sporichthyaceae bacterium]
MAADPSSSAARGRLSVEAIVEAAVRIIEAEGEPAASMRRISAELGVAAMSLYNHVPSKAALLDAVAEWVGAQIELPPDPDADWDTRARTMARAFRDVVRRYPNCMQLAMSRAPMSWVGLRPLEYALDMVHQAGFSGLEAIRVVRAVTSFIIGSIATETARRQAFSALGGGTTVLPGAEPGEEFPHLIALGPRLLQLDPDADFEYGLDLLLHALAAARPAGR